MIVEKNTSWVTKGQPPSTVWKETGSDLHNEKAGIWGFFPRHQGRLMIQTQNSIKDIRIGSKNGKIRASGERSLQ